LLILTFIVLFVSLIAGMQKTTGTHRMLFLTALATLVSVCLQSNGAVDILFLEIGLYFWIIMALPFALYWPTSKQLSATGEEALNEDVAPLVPMQAGQGTERIFT